VRAAWRATLRRLLPPPPVRVLDAGAGTGFLSLLLAGEGYAVTALELAPRMLERLAEKQAALGLELERVQGDAAEPPPGDFDAVIERHLLWTLPDPAGVLAAWRRAAPRGRLVLVESTWGRSSDPLDRVRRHAQTRLRRARGERTGHHREYQPELLAALPLAGGPAPDELLAALAASPWGPGRLERLRDVEWAERQALPFPDRLLGVSPRFALSAG